MAAPVDELTPRRVSNTLAAAWTEEQKLIAHTTGSAAVALANCRLLLPELVTYREAWFWADGFTEAWADDWFAQPGLTRAQVERVCSHKHLVEDNVFNDQAAPIEVIRALAEALAFSWKTWAKLRFGVELETFIEPSEQDGEVFDYVVSFESRPQ